MTAYPHLHCSLWFGLCLHYSWSPFPPAQPSFMETLLCFLQIFCKYSGCGLPFAFVLNFEQWVWLELTSYQQGPWASMQSCSLSFLICQMGMVPTPQHFCDSNGPKYGGAFESISNSVWHFVGTRFPAPLCDLLLMPAPGSGLTPMLPSLGGTMVTCLEGRQRHCCKPRVSRGHFSCVRVSASLGTLCCPCLATSPRLAWAPHSESHISRSCVR